MKLKTTAKAVLWFLMFGVVAPCVLMGTAGVWIVFLAFVRIVYHAIYNWNLRGGGF